MTDFRDFLMKRFSYLALISILITASAAAVLSFVLPGNKIVIEKENLSADLKSHLKISDSKIIVYLVGDVMLDRGVEYMIYKYGEGDFKYPFLKIADDLKKADILFGNLESIISDKGTRVGSEYSFRADPKAMDGLVYAGFDIMSVANNHILDYSRQGMEDCFERLKQAGIEYVGGGFNKQEVINGITKELKGAKITFLAYTNKGSKAWMAGENSLGIGWLDEEIEQDIKKAKEKSDIVIVSFHTGDEYISEANGEQQYFSHLAVKSGADLVVSHHPHVVQPVEKYQGAWIAYSLGNFIFDQGFSKETMEGLLLEIIIENKAIKEVNSKKVKISDAFQPYL